METVISSATEEVVIGPDKPFVVIGERINPTGRKKLSAEMLAFNMDRVKRDALKQVAHGAHALDVNSGVPDDREPEIMRHAVEAVQEVTDVPISIDSSVVEALEAGLKAVKGKPLVNSVTGEDERLELVLPLVAKYGAAVVGISNDETGISSDPMVRLKIAMKIVNRAKDYGIPPEDVLIDPLVLTVSADTNAALATLETIRLIREELGVNMTCGASNVSFGLPWRETINSAFLSMAIMAGMTSAITNPNKPDIRRAILATDLLLGRDDYAANFIMAFREESKRLEEEQANG